ncbi:MAG: hypothetical protein ABTS16_16375, partial [Candidatus Accumulibacter phosphatis]
RYVRLNALGAFCLGLTPDYRPAVEKKPPLLAAELHARYERLSPDEQRILRVLSVVCESVGQTVLQQILDTLAWHDRLGPVGDRKDALETCVFISKAVCSVHETTPIPG